MLEAAYVAGFIDGEGTIGLYRFQASLVPRVSVSNCDISILGDLKAQFGGMVHVAARKRPEWRDGGKWILAGSPAVALLFKQIWPYLRLKRPQAFLVIQALPTYDRGDPTWWTQRDTPYGPKICLRPETVQLREELKGAINILNTKGPRDSIQTLTEAEMFPLIREAEDILDDAVAWALMYGSKNAARYAREGKIVKRQHPAYRMA